MEPKQFTQARRDLLSQLLTAHGWTNILEGLTGYAYKKGKIKSMINDPVSADLLPYLASLQEELSFQRRMKYISIDGRPPQRKAPPAYANSEETPPPELLRLIQGIIESTHPGNKPRPRP